MNNIDQTQKDNLFKGLGVFLEAFRPFMVSVILRDGSEDWALGFANSLSPQQRENWNLSIKNGTTPEAAIDFHHFKSFSISNKNLLKQEFGKKADNLPTWLGEIADVRHKIAHFKDITENEAAKAWIEMEDAAKLLNMTEVADEIVRLKENKTAAEVKREENKAAPVAAGATMPWFRVVTPHIDIKDGRLDESVFAANLAEVALGGGREIYANSSTFFSKTFFTAGLKSIAKTVIKGLNGKEDAENRVISLQTGFGGGKTHTLISLYHLCKGGKKAAGSDTVKELIEYTGTPEFEAANIAVFTNTTNDPVQGRTVDGITIRTLWGELAFQLGGKAAYEIVRENDEKMVSPAGLFKTVLEKCKPALILIDELADYCIKASGVTVGNSSLADQTISFMQELTQSISESSHCVLIVSLPVSVQEMTGNAELALQVLTALENRVVRVGADTKPVDDEEIYEVIRRRLFEYTGDEAQIEAAASQFALLYQDNWLEMPKHVGTSEYKAKLKKSYPFHPELIDVFRVRWASHHGFQRTRGVLRLLAAIVSDLWKRRNSLPGSNILIDAGDVTFSNIDALSGQLKRLYGSGYDAVITADVSGSSSNAYKIDQNKPQFGQWNLAESIASVILLNTFGTDGANRGVSIAGLKLNLLESDGFNHNSINGALDELEAASHYLYWAESGGIGKRYWYHTNPNVNILVNHARNDINPPEINAEVLKRIKEKSLRVQAFNVLVDPSGDVPEQQRLTLVILAPQYRADANSVAENTQAYLLPIATKRGNSERIYRNTMVFLSASENGTVSLFNVVKEYLARKKVSDEYSTQLETAERSELRTKIEDASKQVDSYLVSAYSTILRYSAKNGFDRLIVNQFKESLDAQINTNVYGGLKDAEWLLESVGLGTLKNNNLVPTIDQNVKVKDVYEAFIRFDDKPMIRNADAVRNSLLKYCQEGAFCIAFGDGKTFTNYYLKEGVPSLDVTDSNYWLIDASLKPVPKTDEPIVPTDRSQPGLPIAVGTPETQTTDPPQSAAKELKSITIGGKVPLDRYSELFNYFITPFAMSGNKIEIDVQFKIKSTDSSPLTDAKQQYKSAKEAAKQLGLDFEEE